MDLTFKAHCYAKWTVTDEGLYVDGTLYKYEDITSIREKNKPTTGFISKLGLIFIEISGKKLSLALYYPYNQLDDAQKALDFIREQSREFIEKREKEFQEKLERDPKYQLKKNITASDSIPGKEVTTVLGMVTGTDSYNPAGLFGEGYVGKVGKSYMQITIDNATNKMVDMALSMGADAIISYKTTTSEGGLNMTVVTVTGTAVKLNDAEEKENKAEQPMIGGADEILKYKALLDSGLITQEEFEFKKKQILGM